MIFAYFQKCKKCGRQISSATLRCPYCGALRTGVIVFFIFIALLIGVAIGMVIGFAIGHIPLPVPVPVGGNLNIIVPTT